MAAVFAICLSGQTDGNASKALNIWHFIGDSAALDPIFHLFACKTGILSVKYPPLWFVC
jgi:hypothetical protein